MDDILAISNLSKSYDDFVLGDINFSLQEGTILGLIGPNGAGKSTTIKLLMNMLKRDSGEIRVFGLDYKSSEIEIKNKIGYVGEEQYFYDDKKVKWIGKFVSSFFKGWDEDKFNYLLQSFNISSNKKIRELSKGMKVKLSLAIALSHNPKLIILDDPTLGLDPVVRHEVLNILHDYAKTKSASVLFSSHITEDLTKIADELIFLIDGQIALQGNKYDILSKYKDKQIDEILLALIEEHNGKAYSN